MKAITRALAIAHKEVRLNMRFPVEYFAANLFGPVKSAILMLFLYRGLIVDQSLGGLNRSTYPIYVILGTTCHSLLMASMGTFRSRMTMEKYWQTITATLVAPATTVDMLIGFIIGGGCIHYVSAMTMLACSVFLSGIGFTTFLASCYFLVILSLLGFGIGLVGTTISLCWEGKTFLFDYGMQVLVFLSCLYYPIETVPSSLHFLVRALPTYQVSEIIRSLSLGIEIPHFWPQAIGLTITSLIVLCVPAFIMNYSVKRFGIVGY